MTMTDDVFLNLEELKPSKDAAFVTYVRPIVLEDDLTAYGVYSEDGVQLAVFETEEAAYYSARLNHLEPVLIH
ncbi:MAG: DUF1150 family protein [Rickettsiales bacterium]